MPAKRCINFSTYCIQILSKLKLPAPAILLNYVTSVHVARSGPGSTENTWVQALFKWWKSNIIQNISNFHGPFFLTEKVPQLHLSYSCDNQKHQHTQPQRCMCWKLGSKLQCEYTYTFTTDCLWKAQPTPANCVAQCPTCYIHPNYVDKI